MIPVIGMARSKLRPHGLPLRIALGAALAVLLAGWGVSVHLAVLRSGGDLWAALSPEACRLRACAPPLERAIHTTMGRHIPDPRERHTLTRWMRHGARMNDYFRGPDRVLARRCQSCHGTSPQAGIRLLTYGDALALSQPNGRDPYRRLQRLHVHLFAMGAVFCLLLVGLSFSRWPRPVVLGAGLTPIVALLLSAGLSLWACHTTVGPLLLWICDGLVLLAWPLSTALLAWDLFTSEKATAKKSSG